MTFGGWRTDQREAFERDGFLVLEEGYVDTEAVAELGERVEVALGDGTTGATVAPLPIYDTEKRRPRS